MKPRIGKFRIISASIIMIGTLALLAAVVLPASAFQLNVQDVSAASGQTVEYPIVLDEAPFGLAGYNITADLENPTVGRITGVIFPPWAVLNRTTKLSGNRVIIKAVDITNDVTADSTGIPIATLILSADKEGSSPVTITVNQADDDNGDIMSPASGSGSITVSGNPVSTGSSVGVFRPSAQRFILKNGTEKTVIVWGLSTDIPVTGDWNSDGITDIGVYRPSIQMFILRNGTEKTIIPWGMGSDIPVTGDWNDDGQTDVGVFRPSNHNFILKDGDSRTIVNWGLSTDIPVTGDWNSDGITDVGVYRPSIQMFILRNGTEKAIIPWGMGSDIPVTGDWNDDGQTDVGVFRSSIHRFILKNETEKVVVNWGLSTDMPVTGVWQ